MRVAFANISGGLVFAGQKYGEMLFSKVDLEGYIERLARVAPTILALSEVHLENKNGESEMVKAIADGLELPHFRAMATDRSHIDTSKYMGTAILSRYPIVGDRELVMRAPALEIDRDNGDHWKMLDKNAQEVTLDTPDGKINVANLSYFPFHHFMRRMDEPEFARYRQELVDFIMLGGDDSLVLGDFNNLGVPLSQGFPELFEAGYREGVITKTTVIGYDDQQLDHGLYMASSFEASDPFVFDTGSDHKGVGFNAEKRLVDH